MVFFYICWGIQSYRTSEDGLPLKFSRTQLKAQPTCTKKKQGWFYDTDPSNALLFFFGKSPWKKTATFVIIKFDTNSKIGNANLVGFKRSWEGKWINSARLGIRNNLELMSKTTVNNAYDHNKRYNHNTENIYILFMSMNESQQQQA